MINIGKNRECFFDDYLIDNSRTTAEVRVHEPVRRELVISHDKPWEGCGSDYHNFFYDEEYGIYRMYYLGWKLGEDARGSDGIRACYMESKDAIHWERPSLGLVEYNGSKDNNIITDTNLSPRLDNFMVFKDNNPDCPKSEKYKAILRKVLKGNPKETLCDFRLCCMVSDDGIHFTEKCNIHEYGAYDSLNVAFWDENIKKYRCYFRGNHKIGDRSVDVKMGLEVRDVRYIESEDFVTWTKPVIIDFGDKDDSPLYTNVCQSYERAPQYIIGFPSRYIERKEWTDSFEVLCGKDKRIKRMEGGEPRYGLALTDCLFMVSRNGVNFTKYDEAFIRPGPEFYEHWTYGNCYPARGIIETPSFTKGDDNELSLFICDNSWMGFDYAKDVWRYTIRCDGFVSRHAGATEKMLVTKPFTYDGSEMFANISTSARGYIYFTLKTNDGIEVRSCEMFGDSIDKKIGFPKGEVEKLSGKEVVLEMRMLDADIYAVRFQ